MPACMEDTTIMGTSPLANLIKRSPFKALQEHMRSVMDCISHVPALFTALGAGDEAAVEAAKKAIFEAEAAADSIKNDLRAHLPNRLFMPVDRRDLLEILQLQDSIADAAQDIAGLLTERPMETPESMREPLDKLVARCVDTCAQCAKAIEELDELVEMGFRGREAADVEAMLDEINRLEDETDVMGFELAKALFSIEDELKPVSVLMWYQLIHWVGDLADYAEKVGDRLRLLIAR